VSALEDEKGKDEEKRVELSKGETERLGTLDLWPSRRARFYFRTQRPYAMKPVVS